MKHFKKLHFVLSFLILSLGNISEAALLANGLTSFNTENGLSNSRISCIIEDRYQNVWIATNNGLNRYDGNKINVYRHNSSDSESLLHNMCSCLLQSSAGNVYIGTEMGVQVYDRENDRLKTIPMTDEIGKSYKPSILCMTSRADDEVIASTYNHGVFHLTDGVFVKSDKYNFADEVRHIFCDSKDRLWLNDSKGRVFMEGIIITTIPDIVKITESTEGNIYFASSSNGLYIFDENKGVMEKVKGTDYLLTSVRPGIRGQLLLCTDGNGLLIYNEQTDSIIPSHIRTFMYDFSTSNVKDAIIDNFGNTWVGVYWKGVEICSSQTSDYKYTGRLSATRNTIGSNCVTAMAHDLKLDSDSHGVLWVATDQSGIYRVMDQGESSIHYKPENKNGMPQTVMSIFQESGKYLWLGAASGGVFLMDTETGKCNPLEELTGFSTNMSAVHDITMDGYGNMWFATNGTGLFKLSRNNGEYRLNHYVSMLDNAVVYPDKILSNTYLSSLLIHGDQLFVGSANGLEIFKLSEGNLRKKESLLNKRAICDIKVQSDGTIWVATNVGLYHLDSNEEHTSILACYTEEDGIGDNKVSSIEIDGNDVVWLGTDNGLSALDTKSGSITDCSRLDGMLNDEFSARASVFVNNAMHFGGVRGIVSFYTDEIPTGDSNKSNSGNLRILDLTCGDRHIRPGDLSGRRIIINRHISECSSINLSHKDRSFTLELTVMNPCYTNPSYSYQLDNAVPQQLPNGQNYINFNNLRPGRHHLTVSESSCRNKCVLELHIFRAWFLSIVAFAAYILLSVAVVFTLLHLRKQRKADEIAKQQLKQEMERVRNIKRVEELDIDSPDDIFMKRVMKVVNDNLSNCDMNVEFISQQVGVSRAHFYRRIKSITNMSPLDFLKEIRLKEAARLLSEKNCDITNVSTATGFKYPSSFSTAFRAYWGMSPSEYIKTHNF